MHLVRLSKRTPYLVQKVENIKLNIEIIRITLAIHECAYTVFELILHVALNPLGEMQHIE